MSRKYSFHNGNTYCEIFSQLTAVCFVQWSLLATSFCVITAFTRAAFPHDFLDVLFTGQDIVYVYNGIKYWFQGYTTDSGFHMEIIQPDPASENYLWTYDDISAEYCKKAFLNAPIFEDKTFGDAEEKIERV